MFSDKFVTKCNQVGLQNKHCREIFQALPVKSIPYKQLTNSYLYFWKI